jgi:hypothetical protein
MRSICSARAGGLATACASSFWKMVNRSLHNKQDTARVITGKGGDHLIVTGASISHGISHCPANPLLAIIPFGADEPPSGWFEIHQRKPAKAIQLILHSVPIQ